MKVIRSYTYQEISTFGGNGDEHFMLVISSQDGHTPTGQRGNPSPSQGNVVEKLIFGMPKLKVSHTYVHTYIHTSIHTYICTYVHTHTYIHTYIHMYICTYTHPYIHTSIHTYVHMYIHTHIHTHTYIHTYIHTTVIHYIILLFIIIQICEATFLIASYIELDALSKT